jgi:CBS-domain-containing membrane protein
MNARTFSPLPSTLLQRGATLHRATPLYPPRVTPDNPARDVMTDLKKVAAITVEPAFSVMAANMKMIHSGVRLLLVMNAQRHVIGLLTATDVLGEKPMQYMLKTGCSHDEVQVQHIMTPQTQLEALSLVDVEQACVGDIVETLRRVGRQHALVVETGSVDHWQSVRGIFSSTQIGRQLGGTLDVFEVAHSFAELEHTLAR